MSTDCLFCKIAAGRIPSQTLYEDDEVLAFSDIAPQAPVHVLLIPKRHIADVQALDSADAALLSRLFETARRLAEELGVAESGYRFATNVGKDGGQSVAHLHFHLLAGRALQWPPG